MAINVPVPHHDYVYFTDTKQSKDNIIQQAIDDNKEACYVGYGIGQFNSEYQPSPIKDPDYYMQYCNSDNYDYLRDYRLIWGYGIGISETDVIVNINNGEHLAEGTEACDSYVAPEGVNTKRGIWLQFTGITLINPSIIPSVNLPDCVISIKNLTNSLSSINIDIQQFNTENIINWDNAFSNKVVNFKDFTFDLNNCRSMNSTFNTSRISNYINNKATDFNFINVPKNIIANNCFNQSTVNNDIHTLLTNYIGGTGMFQNTNNINVIDFTNCKLTLYSSMFYNNYSTFILDITNSEFKCDTILENVFENVYTNCFPKIDFSNVKKINVLFKFDAPNEDITYDINLSTLKDIPVTDIISCNFYKGYTTILNITAPDIKLTKYNNAFHISGCTINFLNTLKARSITDIINLYVDYYVDLNYFIYSYGQYPITLNGTFVGYNILYIDDFDSINGNVKFTYYDNIIDESKEFPNLNYNYYNKLVSFDFKIDSRTNNNIKESISSIGNCISGYNFPSPSVYTNIYALEIFDVDSIKTVNIDNTNYPYILPTAVTAFCTMNYNTISIIEINSTEIEVIGSYIKFNVTNLSKMDNKIRFRDCIIDAENIDFELYWNYNIYIRSCHNIKLLSLYNGYKVILKKFNNIISYKIENMQNSIYEQCTCFLDINNNNIINTEDGRVYIGYVGFYNSSDNITSIDDIINSTLKGMMPTILNPNNAELTYALYGRFDYKLSLLNNYFNDNDTPGFVDIYKDCNIINDTGNKDYIVTLSDSNQYFYISQLCNDWSNITIDKMYINLDDADFYNNIYLNDEYPAIIPNAIKIYQAYVTAKNTIINFGDSYASVIQIGTRYICDNLITININIVRTCNYFSVNTLEHKNDKLVNFNCTNINYIQHLELPYCSKLSDESIAKIINTPPTNELQINETVYNKLSEEDINAIVSTGCSIISVSNTN